VAWLVGNLLGSQRPVVARQRDRDERRR
jgi:hypothetical protein